jgi:succinate dehydrogenase / fumarate reductase flavoprotein subunit
MMECGSVFRTEAGLTSGIDAIRDLSGRYARIAVKDKGRIFNYELMEALELGHQLELCGVILASALRRRESRGAHFREDYPERDDAAYLKHTLTFLTPAGPEVRYRPVSITLFQPKARVY